MSPVPFSLISIGGTELRREKGDVDGASAPAAKPRLKPRLQA